MRSPYVELWELELAAGRARADLVALSDLWAPHIAGMRRAVESLGRSARETYESMRPVLEALDAQANRQSLERLEALRRIGVALRRARDRDSQA